MAITLDILATGQLPNAQGTLYKFLSTQSGNVKTTLVNTSAGTIKINVWLKNGSSTARLISPKDMELDAQDSYSTCYEEIGQGDSILGKATSANLVDFVVNGLKT